MKNNLSIISETENRTYHKLIIGWLTLVAVFSIIRASYEYRWSAWAQGDAQCLIAARHFQEEGFVKHYFLTYYHPGYLGASHGTETDIGYYTHYPPLYAILNGFLMKYFSDSFFFLKSVAVLFSIFALYIFYKIILRVANDKIAFWSTIFIGFSISFYKFVDCLSPYSYDEFYRMSAILFFIMATDNCKHKKIYFLLSWIFTFLQSFNSFDYILFLQMFYLLYLVMFKPKITKWKIILFMFSAPVIGFILHFIQNILALGSISAAITDFANIFGERSVLSLYSEDGIRITGINIYHYILLVMNNSLSLNFGFTLIAVTLLFIIVILFSNINTNLKNDFISTMKLVFVFILTGFIWWLVFPVQSIFFPVVSIRQFFPSIGLIWGILFVYAINIIKDNNKTFFIRGGMILLIIMIICLPFYNTYNYFRYYPNLIDKQESFRTKLTTDEIIQIIPVLNKASTLTSYGDIIMHNLGCSWENLNQSLPIFEYYTNRYNLPLGKTAEQFKKSLEYADNYRKTAIKYNPDAVNIKIHILLNLKSKSLVDYFKTISSRIAYIGNNYALLTLKI